MKFNAPKHIGLITGFGIAIIFVIYQIHQISESKRWIYLVDPIAIAMNLGLVIGGTLSGFLIEHCFIKRYTRLWQIWGAIVVTILISPLSLYGGIVFSQVGASISLHFGIFASIVFFIVIMECLGAVIGAVLGWILEKVIHR